jgi:hypothetical protein
MFWRICSLEIWSFWTEATKVFCHPSSLAKYINLKGPRWRSSNFDFVQTLLIRILVVTAGWAPDRQGDCIGERSHLFFSLCKRGKLGMKWVLKCIYRINVEELSREIFQPFRMNLWSLVTELVNMSKRTLFLLKEIWSGVFLVVIDPWSRQKRVVWHWLFYNFMPVL